MMIMMMRINDDDEDNISVYPDDGDVDDDDETKPLYPFVPITTDPFSTVMGKTMTRMMLTILHGEDEDDDGDSDDDGGDVGDDVCKKLTMK